MKFYIMLTSLTWATFHSSYAPQQYRRTMSAPIACTSANQKFPLHQAIIDRDHDSFYKLIKKHYDLNKQNHLGMTALHLAVEQDYHNVVSVLLQHKANPNITSSPSMRQCTPLHWAVLNCHTTIVQVLARHKKTDRTIKDITDQTALQLAIKYGYIQAIQALTPKN